MLKLVRGNGGEKTRKKEGGRKEGEEEEKRRKKKGEGKKGKTERTKNRKVERDTQDMAGYPAQDSRRVTEALKPNVPQKVEPE